MRLVTIATFEPSWRFCKQRLRDPQRAEAVDSELFQNIVEIECLQLIAPQYARVVEQHIDRLSVEDCLQAGDAFGARGIDAVNDSQIERVEFRAGAAAYAYHAVSARDQLSAQLQAYAAIAAGNDNVSHDLPASNRRRRRVD